MTDMRHWLNAIQPLTEANEQPQVDAHRSGTTTMEIEMLFIPNSMRGKGVGRATYEKWEAALPKSIHLVTAWAADTGSGRSNGFWEAMGFEYRYKPAEDSEVDDQELWWWMQKGVNGHPTPDPVPVDTFEDDDNRI